MRFEKITSKELKERLRSRKLCGIALDIDDTLAYTDYHYFAAMSRFANPEKLTRKELIKKYKSFRNVPFWQSKKATRLINKLLRSSDFHEAIPYKLQINAFLIYSS